MTALAVGFIIVFMAACTAGVLGAFRPRVRLPESVPGFGTRTRGNPYTPEILAIYLRQFVSEYTRVDNKVDTRKILDDLDIDFLTSPIHIPGYSSAGITGWTDSKKSMQISIKTSLRKTALSHELCHVVLWNAKGDPDADHIGRRWTGWTQAHDDLIDRMRTSLGSLDDTTVTRGSAEAPGSPRP